MVTICATASGSLSTTGRVIRAAVFEQPRWEVPTGNLGSLSMDIDSINCDQSQTHNHGVDHQHRSTGSYRLQEFPVIKNTVLLKSFTLLQPHRHSIHPSEVA
jgi:hypothetical protein